VFIASLFKTKPGMFKTFIFVILLSPLVGLAQLTISGKVLNQADNKPIANVSVFLSNATIGDKTAEDGTFTLQHVRPGKYDLVVSIVGFGTYYQTILAGNSSIKLPDIILSPKTIMLGEVNIKTKHDPYWGRNFDWFKDEFLGTSYLAKECRILNPEILDLDYDEETGTLTASSYDFVVIENPELGYRIKYLLADFNSNLRDSTAKKIYYKGSVLYEEMKGTPSQVKRWRRSRQEVYENSEMHFLRSAASNRIGDEGFRVLKLVAERPSDSLINAKIKLYKESSLRDDKLRDSLSFWMKKSKLPKTSRKLIRNSLKSEEIVKRTDQQGLYDLVCDNCALYITYNKNHHFPGNDRLDFLENNRNTENSLINFNSPHALFYKNGAAADPYSLLFNGVWGRNRIADLLPVDYEAIQDGKTNNDSTAVEKAIARLKNFSDQHIAEKGYLHFDKPYYAAGDTIYFKAYLTLGQDHQLSNLSGLLHVDLINTNNQIDKSIKLQLTDGVGWGDFALPDSLPKGNYRVRAYANWMRNDGSGAYFEQTIPVGSILSDKVTESISRSTVAINAKADVQFFAEGGNMVTGIRSKIAFKAIGTNGLGINVKGLIVDNENEEITATASEHLGMGYFYLTPREGKTYKARFTYSDGTQNTIGLPNPDAKGIVLSVNNDSLPKASVKIEANNAFYQENKNKDYSLVIYSGGIATTVICKLDSPVIILDILKRRLKTGIATVTLFSPAGEPLCERLLFIQKYDQLHLAVSSDKKTYEKREKINISLNVKTNADEPSAGHFSVSVIDEGKVTVDENTENTILTNLLLTSDLKGFIEQPNYYFNSISDKKLSDLDLVMLTHGYRGFEWKQLLNNGYPPIAYQPENNLEITGTAKSLIGKPLINGKISLISVHGGAFASETTDNKGRFRFSNLVFTDTAQFILQAINAKGKNTTQLIYDKELAGPDVTPAIPAPKEDLNQLMAAYIENSRKQQEDIEKYANIKGKVLKGVTIKDKRINELPSSSSSLVSPKFADQVILSDQMAKGGSFSDRIQGALHYGIVVRSDSTFKTKAYLQGSPMRVILDGADTDGDLNEINGDDVESIEVLRFGGTVGAYSGFASTGTKGILIINSKKNKGLQAKDISSIGILPITPGGFYKAREFYSPKYESHAANNRPDLRTTIFWQAELVTDKEGNASLRYYNADGPGTYRLVIEGIDEKGNIGRQVYRYKVE
jgi:CarboxypepD_reg-like domain